VATIESALALHAAGNLPGAEQAYRNVLLQDKKNYVAMEKLALICLMTGRLDEGKRHLESALKLNPNNPESHYNLAAANKSLGLWKDVVQCCRKTLQVGGTIPEVYLLLGEALNAQGQPEEAIATFKKALALRPGYSDAHNQMGMVLLSQGKIADAAASLEKAVKLNPGSGHAHYNLSSAFLYQGRFEEAVASANAAVRCLPIAECYLSLGNALLESFYYTAEGRKRISETVAAFSKAVELKPEFAEAHNNLGLALREQQRLDEALASFTKAVALNPNHFAAYRNMSLILSQQHKYDEAIACHERAFQLQCNNLPPESPLKKLGSLLFDLRKIPVIYGDEAEITEVRNRYASTLEQASSLVRELNRPFDSFEIRTLAEIILTIENFFVPYQQLDDKELATSYARLATEILRSEIEPFLSPIEKRSGDRKLRVGIATEQLRNHHCASWALGWLANLPADDYEFFLYSINGQVDDTTMQFASFGTFRWLPFLPHNYLPALKTIKDDNLDVLLITDVGLSPGNRLLSLVRLAPIQCVGWAHPVTTGSAEVDYFLSSELMEPEAADDHYSETLVRFRNIGLNLDYPDNSSVTGTRSQFALPADKTIYGSVQSLFKYLPQFDFVYPAIAKQDPDAFFVFLSHQTEHATSAFKKRLKSCFESSGVSFEKHVKILPRLTPVQFMQLLTVLDVNLDSIGWSGGFTTMRSLAMNCPVVTLPGEFMRGRHSCAMLTMIDVKELIADSIDDFISLSCKIGMDKELRSHIVEKIKANKHKMFNDNECVQDLDRFLKKQS
jgi:predicted O-linked N-acetylglucosamine transferase (SPINDLY family)